jgi:hypothetical protein
MTGNAGGARIGSAAAGAMALSTVAVTLPASAAPVTSSHASIGAARSASPAGATGTQICTSNGVMCLQRVTYVTNGSAYVDIWAYLHTWTGWFSLYGPDGHIANSPYRTWERGGAGWTPDIPQGTGYYVIAYQDQASPRAIAQIDFSVKS